MTTNQTIDGVLVSRELLEAFAAYVADSPNAIMRTRANELRALLEAPAVEERGSSHGFEQSPNNCRHDERAGVWWREGSVTRTGRECRSCGSVEEDPVEPAAQPQGEPVAWETVGVNEFGLECRKTITEQKPSLEIMLQFWGDRFTIKQSALVYAEQPAPVVVVLPEREAMRDIIAQAIGGDAYDCTRVWSAWGVGTMSDDDFIPIADQEERLYEIADACLDEVTRLNTKSR